jgi:hypothetical protein
MRGAWVLLALGALWFGVACGGDGKKSSNTDTAGGDDTAVAETTGGDETAAETGGDATTCTLTKATYTAMTRFVELSDDSGKCNVSFTVATKEGETVDWANMVKSGTVLQVTEGWDVTKANTKYPCDDPQAMGQCYGMTGTVTLTTFEPVQADCEEGGSVTGKKIVGEVDASGDRPGNTGSAKYSFDLTF